MQGLRTRSLIHAKNTVKIRQGRALGSTLPKPSFHTSLRDRDFKATEFSDRIKVEDGTPNSHTTGAANPPHGDARAASVSAAPFLQLFHTPEMMGRRHKSVRKSLRNPEQILFLAKVHLRTQLVFQS